jgi:hypothetical protein
MTVSNFGALAAPALDRAEPNAERHRLLRAGAWSATSIMLAQDPAFDGNAFEVESVEDISFRCL